MIVVFLFVPMNCFKWTITVIALITLLYSIQNECVENAIVNQTNKRSFYCRLIELKKLRETAFTKETALTTLTSIDTTFFKMPIAEPLLSVPNGIFNENAGGMV